MNAIFENIPYQTKDLYKNDNYTNSVVITPCPYLPDKIVAGAYSCKPCRFNGGCNIDSTVRCSYRHFMRSELKLQAYEAENAWWFHFFHAVGSNNYDAEYANSLRIDGVSPEEAAKIIKNS